METKLLCTNVTTHIANILHSKLAAYANSLQRPSFELQYLRKNFILRLTINNFVSVIPKRQRHSSITSDDTVLKSFIGVLFIVNSNDFSWVFCSLDRPRLHNIDKGNIRIDKLQDYFFWTITTNFPTYRDKGSVEWRLGSRVTYSPVSESMLTQEWTLRA